MTHKLNINLHTKPVQQKRRKFAPERNEVIQEDIERLLAANIIFKVKYPAWLDNSVMVKKFGRGWRMCVDITDLNNVCPKNCYSLSSINQKFEAVADQDVLNFLDLYKGYHQVFMDSEDAPNTTFITA